VVVLLAQLVLLPVAALHTRQEVCCLLAVPSLAD
jgi:hypothetical protein